MWLTMVQGRLSFPDYSQNIEFVGFRFQFLHLLTKDEYDQLGASRPVLLKEMRRMRNNENDRAEAL
ncbi:MAG: hypothetical protein WBN08_14760 [Thiogranum sp.]